MARMDLSKNQNLIGTIFKNLFFYGGLAAFVAGLWIGIAPWVGISAGGAILVAVSIWGVA